MPICKHCGKPNLRWFKERVGWTLVEGNKPHSCPTNKNELERLAADEKRRRAIKPEPSIQDYLSRVPSSGSWESKARKARASNLTSNGRPLRALTPGNAGPVDNTSHYRDAGETPERQPTMTETHRTA